MGDFEETFVIIMSIMLVILLYFLLPGIASMLAG